MKHLILGFMVLIAALAIAFSISEACEGSSDCLPNVEKIVINKNTYHTDRSITNTSRSSSSSFSGAAAGAASKSNATGGTADSTSRVEIKDNSQTTNIDRRYVNPGSIPMPSLPGFYTEPTEDPSFRSIADLFAVFGDEFSVTEGVLKQWAKGGSVDVHFQISRGEDEVGRIYDSSPQSWKWLYIAKKASPNLIVTGFTDGVAADGGTNSFQVLAEMGLAALKDGNNFLIFRREGIHRAVEASGWGVGLYTAGGLNSANGQQSITPGGGTGYARAKTGPQDKPWIHAYVGWMPMGRPAERLP
jgi:hypothetical protein